ncbi:MAG: hypothetical protein CMN76_20610 [Spirochaetaceae bacterium]|nr:hypothetical protein [Spirochaetaceae bacterium]
MEFLDESLLYFGLLIGTMMTGWSIWMLFLHIRKSREQRKNSSVGLWIILLALLLGLGALGKPLRTIVERFRNGSSMLQNAPSHKIAGGANVGSASDNSALRTFSPRDLLLESRFGPDERC